MKIHPPIEIMHPESHPAMIRITDDYIAFDPPVHEILRIETVEQVESMLNQISRMHSLFQSMADAAYELSMFNATICGRVSLSQDEMNNRKKILKSIQEIKERFPSEYDWVKQDEEETKGFK